MGACTLLQLQCCRTDMQMSWVQGFLQMGWTACLCIALPCIMTLLGLSVLIAPAAAKKKPEKNPPHPPNTSRLQPLSQEMLDFFASRWALQQLSP